jgi:hypothetical protein
MAQPGSTAPLAYNDAAKPAALALETSHFVHVLQHSLLVMSARSASPQDRLEAAERVFQVWRPICRLMSELEAVCPNASEAGYGQAEALREVAQREQDTTGVR